MRTLLLVGISIAASTLGCSNAASSSIEKLTGDGGLPAVTVGGCKLDINELASQNGISAECRAAIDKLLPQPASNVKGRLYALGSERTVSGRAVFVAGVDGSGTAMSPPDVDVDAGTGSFFTVSVVKAGVTTELAADAYAVVDLTARGGTPFGISLITDYSASMTEGDIADASAIYGTFFEVLPPVYETEVTIFSETVTKKLPFSKTKSDVLSALAVDKSYKRESTALYDAMGSSLVALNARSTPIKLLVTTTDGRENASKQYKTKESVKVLIEEGRVFVVMLGGLFADQGDLRELSGSRGVFSYARGVRAATDALKAFVDSLGKTRAIEVKPPHDDADEIVVKAGGHEARFPK